jgi:hypothetical protein
LIDDNKRTDRNSAGIKFRARSHPPYLLRLVAIGARSSSFRNEWALKGKVGDKA